MSSSRSPGTCRRQTCVPWEVVAVYGGNRAVLTHSGRASLEGDGLPGGFCAGDLLRESKLPTSIVPAEILQPESAVVTCLFGKPLAFLGWRNLYTTRHNEVAEKARSMIRCVEESLHASLSVEIGLYKKILAESKSLELSFVDVKMLLFKPKYGAVLHLAGLHYCFTFLEVPVVDMLKAVVDNEISEHQVCMRWSTLGRLLYGFRMRDESHSVVSMLDVASSQGHEVLQLLSRGTVHEVMRVQISLSNPTSC